MSSQTGSRIAEHDVEARALSRDPPENKFAFQEAFNAYFPTLVSNFPNYVPHPDYDFLRQGVEELACKLAPWLKGKYAFAISSSEATYTAMTAAYCYPYSNREKALSIARMYLAWVPLDDSIDATTGVQTKALSMSLLQAVKTNLNEIESPDNTDDGVLKEFSSFFHTLPEGCDPEALLMGRAGFTKYAEATCALRTHEADKDIITLDQWLAFRPYNVGMPAMYSLHPYAGYKGKQLSVDVFARDDFQHIFYLSGITYGIIMDMIGHNMERLDTTRYIKIIPIVIKAYPNANAADKLITMIDENEKDLKRCIEFAREAYPLEAEAVFLSHAQTIRWIVTGKLRYKQSQ